MNKIYTLLFLLLVSSSNANALVRITNMNDFAFGTWSGSGSLQASDGICIVETAANKNYGIRPRGSGAGFAFTVASGANTLAYTVEWQGSVGAMTALTANVRTRFNNGSGTTTPPCGGATNATLRITFPQANLEAATNGSYTGTLTIILSAT